MNSIYNRYAITNIYGKKSNICKDKRGRKKEREREREIEREKEICQFFLLSCIYDRYTVTNIHDKIGFKFHK